MPKECLTAPNGPPAMGPYSHAVTWNNLLFVSGQGALYPDGSGVCRDSLEAEARLALDNLKAILEDCGSGLDYVLKTTVYLANMDDFQAFNEIYKEYFPKNCPARTCIQAGRLPADFRVEIDAIAAVKE